jgi:putative sterol carrier protein
VIGDKTIKFFDTLGRGESEPLLAGTSGTLRFELVGGDGEVDHWLVTVDGGAIDVSKRRRKADCTIRAEARVFDGLATGEVNATAATLRGALVVEGDAELLVRFQRILPAPPRRRGRRAAARSRG